MSFGRCKLYSPVALWKPCVSKIGVCRDSDGDVSLTH